MKKIAKITFDLLHMADKKMNILDWGCGCGSKMGWFREWNKNVKNFGLDLNPENIQYATENKYIDYGVSGDASKLEWIPTASFDRVVSFAAVYHLPLDAQCRVYKEWVRILKPNGIAYNGW